MNVQLVSKTQIDQNFWKRCLAELEEFSPEEIEAADLPTMEDLTVFIARVSSGRENKWEEGAKLIRFLIRKFHWSPFEHAFMTFEIVTSLPIATQFLRHRSFTFQQFSQRYAEATRFESFELRRQAEKNRQSSVEKFDPDIVLFTYQGGFAPGAIVKASERIEGLLNTIQDLYQELLKEGVAKECARMILPQCTQTTLYMTGNLRSWIHFLQLRDDPHAQKEAQEIAREIKKIFIEECPVIAEALEWKVL